AKVPHPWEFVHNEIGYNYRLPNLNAALGCAQMNKLLTFIENKRETSRSYQQFFQRLGVEFISEPEGAQSNYWLNAIKLKSPKEKEEFLIATNASNVMTRPLWKSMEHLKMYQHCQRTTLEVTADLLETVVCIPSSVRV